MQVLVRWQQLGPYSLELINQNQFNNVFFHNKSTSTTATQTMSRGELQPKQHNNDYTHCLFFWVKIVKLLQKG